MLLSPVLCSILSAMHVLTPLLLLGEQREPTVKRPLSMDYKPRRSESEDPGRGPFTTVKTIKKPDGTVITETTKVIKVCPASHCCLCMRWFVTTDRTVQAVARALLCQIDLLCLHGCSIACETSCWQYPLCRKPEFLEITEGTALEGQCSETHTDILQNLLCRKSHRS